ncbi:MAG: hypothetical protein JJT85_01780 [Chromatiales bacterium]|nr:hypothetical protein [Chromatiales bacterium]
MSVLSRFLLALSLSALLAGCAGRGGVTGPEETDPPVGALGVRIDSVTGYRVLDDSNLILYAPNRRNMWHVELVPRCFSLRSASTLRLRGRTGRLAGFAGDAVELDRAGGRETCRVSNVYRIDEQGLEALLARLSPDEDDGDSVEIPRVED